MRRGRGPTVDSMTSASAAESVNSSLILTSIQNGIRLSFMADGSSFVYLALHPKSLVNTLFGANAFPASPTPSVPAGAADTVISTHRESISSTAPLHATVPLEPLLPWARVDRMFAFASGQVFYAVMPCLVLLLLAMQPYRHQLLLHLTTQQWVLML